MVFRQVLRTSCEGSSMKALPRMVKAKSCVQRALWVLALLAGLSAVGYQLAKLFMGYFQYSTSVNIAEVQGSPPFPDVTVCHVDPTWSFELIKTSLSGEQSYENFSQKVSHLKESYEENSDEYRKLSDLDSVIGYLQNEPGIHSKAPTLQERLVIDCVYNHDWDLFPCRDNTSSVTRKIFLDPIFGLCVTFSLTLKNTKGLHLVLYLDEREESAEGIEFNVRDQERLQTSTTGARVVIHPRHSFPDIFLSSHTIQAGKQVSFTVEGIQRSVLGEPYGTCITPEDAENAKNIPGFAINRHGYECYRMCAKDYILLDCGCLDMYYASTEEDRKAKTLCGLIFEDNLEETLTRIQCAEQVVLNMTDAEVMYKLCKCPTPCEQFLYEFSVQELTWLHESFHLSFYEQYIRNSSFSSKFKQYEEILKLSKTNKRLAQEKVTQTNLIHRNFAEVRVLNYQKTHFHYSETPLVSIEALFGNLGGILNLWAGITFITVIEIVEFVYQLILVKRKERNDRKSVEQKNGPADV